MAFEKFDSGEYYDPHVRVSHFNLATHIAYYERFSHLRFARVVST